HCFVSCCSTNQVYCSLGLLTIDDTIYTYIRTSRFPGTRLLSNIRISGLRLLTPGWDSPS
uniref:hypothetical protein n=1 Tax=uncultured Victivallis sp. TaxID=354118 RepID=UPI0025CE49C6